MRPKMVKGIVIAFLVSIFSLEFGILANHADASPDVTLGIYSSPSGVSFTVDGAPQTTPWSGNYSEGSSVVLVMPALHDGNPWIYWLEDEDSNRTRTVTLNTTSVNLTGAFGFTDSVHILANGSINPPDAPIQHNGSLYNLTSNIWFRFGNPEGKSGLVIQRNGITLDGGDHEVGRPEEVWCANGDYPAMNLLASNVTIKNIIAWGFCRGLTFSGSNNTITSSAIFGLGWGIQVGGSGHKITWNMLAYPRLSGVSNSLIHGNEIGWSFDMIETSNNIITENNITCPTDLYGSSNNTFYHNNFLGASLYGDFTSFWDNGYPSGGNYWSDYSGIDEGSGPDGLQLGSDGIGDTPYVIDGNNQDHYPLMSPWISTTSTSTNVTKEETEYPVVMVCNATVTFYEWTAGTARILIEVIGETGTSGYVRIIQPVGLNSSDIKVFLNDTRLTFPSVDPARSLTTNGSHYFIYFEFTFNSAYEVVVAFSVDGDTNYDGTVNVFDAILLAGVYGLNHTSENWNPHCDLNEDMIVDIFDAIILAGHFGENW